VRPDWPPPPVVATRSLPQFRLPGCWKWRSSLKAACRDYAFLCWLAKYNCDEDLVETVDGHEYHHHCGNLCWAKSYEYMQKVVDRYTRLLVRGLKGRH